MLERSTEAEEAAGGVAGLAVRVLARVYGCAESRAAVEETVRVERRMGGISSWNSLLVVMLYALKLNAGPCNRVRGTQRGMLHAWSLLFLVTTRACCSHLAGSAPCFMPRG